MPCQQETQAWTVASTSDATSLASLLNCSNGSFAVKWFGDALLSQTIAITQGTSLNITGMASTGAAAGGNHSTRLFAVDGASSLHLTDMVLAKDVELGGAIPALDQSNISFGGNMTFASNTAGCGGAVCMCGSVHYRVLGWRGDDISR